MAGFSRGEAPLRSQWIGHPRVEGSSETIQMILLTISIAGLQFTWICSKSFQRNQRELN